MPTSGTRLTRTELYDLAWSEPIKKLAERFGVSDVAVAKVCRQMHVPVPGRGYWTRRSAGKSVIRVSLPLRPPGLSEIAIIGGGLYAREYDRPTEDEILGPEPPEPVFGETIEAVEKRVEAGIGKVTVAKTLDLAAPTIAKLLRKDDIKREKAAGGMVFSWEKPQYDTAAQQRRLRILSAIFLATARFGGRADTWGGGHDKPIEEFAVVVGHQRVLVKATVVESSP